MTSKNPWETKEGKVIWKTEATYWTWLRGALRKLWCDYPLRQQWKKNSLRPVTKEERIAKKYHPSTKNVGQCSMCGEWMAGSKLECDHKIESKGCTSRETAESFLWHCGGLVGDDFRLACKPCHKIQSYSQKQGITFEEATIQKEAIEILKDSKKCLTWFKERSILYPSNAKLRREAIIKYLEENNK